MPFVAQKYANLANDAYNDIDYEKYVKNKETYNVGLYEYKVLEQFSDKKTDYQGTIYQDIKTGDIFVAHRGTASKEDGMIDYLMATRGANLQIPHALALTERALNTAKVYAEINNVPIPQVSITGHSLGGALAEVSAYEYGLQAVTFNGYGSVGLQYQNLAGEYKTVPQSYNGDITNHMMAGDIVNIANPHIGKEILYARPDHIESLKYWNYGDGNPDNNSMWTAVGLQTLRYKTHSMSNFLNEGEDLSILIDDVTKGRQVAIDNAQTIFEFRRDILDNKEAVLNKIMEYEHKAKIQIAEKGFDGSIKLDGYLGMLFNDKIEQYTAKDIEVIKYLFNETDRFKGQFEDYKKQSHTTKDYELKAPLPEQISSDRDLTFIKTGNNTVDLLLANLEKCTDNPNGFDLNVMMTAAETKEGKVFTELVDKGVEEMKMAEASLKLELEQDTRSKNKSCGIGIG